jgi:hypothetical protein
VFPLAKETVGEPVVDVAAERDEMITTPDPPAAPDDPV